MNIFDDKYEILEDTVVTLGKFDGLHEGHKKLIEVTVEEAKRLGCKSLVYTFNQNPLNVLKGQQIKTLISKQEKIEILEEKGIDYIVFENFTYDFSKMKPEEFIKKIIKGKLHAKMLVVGFNYRFGRNAEGDVNTLSRYSKKFNFELKVIEPIRKDGEVVSSSLIRKKIEIG